MSTYAYTPGIGNAPFGNLPANPQGSNYAAASGYTTTETILLAKAVKQAIFDSAPAQYDALKVLMARPFEEVNNDEFEYLETTFGRSTLEANGIVAIQAAAPGVPQTQNITLTAGTITHASPDLIIVYPDNSKAVIRSIAGNVITVESHTGNGLPAVAVGDIFSIQSTIAADGMNYFSNYERVETITRYNYIQLFARARRWSRMELQKYINSGTTDYLNFDKEHKMKQLRIDLFNSYFNGERGELRISNAYIAKSMGGVFPTMVAAGSLSANPTLAGLQTAFESLAFATNFKAEGGVRFIYATHEMLNEFSKIYKQPGLRYQPTDMTIKLDLQKIEVGGMSFVFVPTELFREESCFPAEWRKRILVLDQESIAPIKMKGIAEMEMGETPDPIANQTRENFKDWWVIAQMSIRFHNPLGSFYIDVQ
jgi:hypothetical protein